MYVTYICVCVCVLLRCVIMYFKQSLYLACIEYNKKKIVFFLTWSKISTGHI